MLIISIGIGISIIISMWLPGLHDVMLLVEDGGHGDSRGGQCSVSYIGKLAIQSLCIGGAALSARGFFHQMHTLCFALRGPWLRCWAVVWMVNNFRRR